MSNEDIVRLSDIDYNTETGFKENIARLIDEGFTIVFEPGEDRADPDDRKLLFPVKITIKDGGQEICQVSGMVIDDVMAAVYTETPEREPRTVDLHVTP